MNRAMEEQTCARKIRYSKENAAALEHKSKYLLRPYKCSICYGFHMTSMATQRNATVVRC